MRSEIIYINIEMDFPPFTPIQLKAQMAETRSTTMNINEIVIFWSARDAAFVAELMGRPGRISRGATYLEALTNAFAGLRRPATPAAA